MNKKAIISIFAVGFVVFIVVASVSKSQTNSIIPLTPEAVFHVTVVGTVTPDSSAIETPNTIAVVAFNPTRVPDSNSGTTATGAAIPATPSAGAVKTPASTNTPQPVATATPGLLPAGRKLSDTEQAALGKIETDSQELTNSLNRLDQMLTDTHPEEEGWFGKLANETGLWEKLLQKYKNSAMPDRVGSLVAPDWLAALAHLNNAGDLLAQAYRQADGKQVSRADQEVVYAELYLAKVKDRIGTLKQR